MELSDYIRILRKNWVVIVVIALVGVGAAAVFSLTRTPMYEATSEVFVSSQAGDTIGEQAQGNTYTQQRVASYVQLATSPRVLDPVIADLGLTESATELAARTEVSSALETTIIRVTVSDADPQAAADASNSVTENLTEAITDVETLPDRSSVPVKVTQIQAATAPEAPVSPDVPLNLALGLLVGLALGVGLAVMRTVLDTRVRSTRDIASITDRPLIGAIPFDPKSAERPLILQADPQHPRSEAFRALRTNLQFLDLESESTGHSFVVTSSVPGEGKSTSAVNLAIALADAGKRVMIVDADLRKPRVAEYFGIEGGVGLTDVLIGRAELQDVLQKWGKRSLYVLPSGKVPPNPSELLGSSRMRALVEMLMNDLDVIILDAPPLLPVTDAAVLAKFTSGAMVVVAAGSTKRDQVQGALDVLETVHAQVAGIVVTKVPLTGPDAGDYGYGYGYGYGPELEAAPKGRGRRARGNG
ncbi:polysaccharide biosynthesis tyrosine autokinase [Microbacterium sp. ZXX196]|uniref:polysaccharide biosynthesis tyrosine autokinase n=1 Tax=Microbacterium sp. ZXX196 TaxID=2609291 RepID=UPI001327881F|nr:polysaccharide biosynthesis tyrosine autokinase [Microbacterium sp. ZXX196]